MVSRCSSVMAARGSSGPAHSGTGAGASSSSRPSATSIPTTACRIDLAIDQDSSRVWGTTTSAGRSQCSRVPP
jgi:hypothetical protein